MRGNSFSIKITDTLLSEWAVNFGSSPMVTGLPALIKDDMPLLYAWVTPAFVKGAPVDHTWVTTYDSRTTAFKSPQQLQAAGEHYWYCWGKFHSVGVSSTHIGGLILTVQGHAASHCLVPSNVAKARGTIRWYGIDGVCHQVANQILFPSNARVDFANGYRLSSAIFGTFGRRVQDWYWQRVTCQVDHGLIPPRRSPMSLLYSRAMYVFQGASDVPFQLEGVRRQLLTDIDAIGFATRAPNETISRRVRILNSRIMRFVEEVSEIVRDSEISKHLLGVDAKEVINLVDPEFFVFPTSDSRPER